nr:MAG TPA_asm: hypothetical protein [Bacteriophage sp.]
MGSPILRLLPDGRKDSQNIVGKPREGYNFTTIGIDIQLKVWYYNCTERLETLLSNECRSLFLSASFLVSTLSGIVAGFVCLAAFLFIGIILNYLPANIFLDMRFN